MSKGSKRRPMFISEEQYAENFKRIFGKAETMAKANGTKNGGGRGKGKGR